MNYYFIIKLPDGQLIDIYCERIQLKQKIAKYVQNIPFDCINLIDENGNSFNCHDIQNLQNIYPINLKLIDTKQLIQENLIQKKLSIELNQKIIFLETKLVQLESNYQQEKLQNQQIQQEKNKIEQELQLLQQQWNELKQQNENLYQISVNQKNSLENMKIQQQKTIQQNQQTQDQLKNANELLKQNIAQLEGKQQIEMQYQSLHLENQYIKQQQQSLQMQFQQYCEQFNAQQQHLQNDFNEQLESQTRLTKKTQQEYTKLKNEHDQELQSLNLQLQRERQQNLQLRIQVREQQNQIEELNDRIQDPNQQANGQAAIFQLRREYYLKNEQDLISEQTRLREQLQESQRQTQEANQKFNQLDFDYNQEKNKNDNLRTQLNDQNKKKQQLEVEVQQLKLSLTNTQSNLQDSQVKEKQNLDEISQLKILNNQLHTKFEDIQREYQKLNLESNQMNFENQNIKIQRDLQLQQIQEELKQSETFRKIEQEQKDKRRIVDQNQLRRLSQNFSEIVKNEKVQNPFEILLNSLYKIDNFHQDPNIQLFDQTYEIYEIDYNKTKFTQFIEQEKYFLMEDCLYFTKLGQIQCSRSIQQNVETDQIKGYLIRINEAPNDTKLTNKILLRKDLKCKKSQSSTIEEAAKNSINNFFCDWLLEDYKKKMNNEKQKTFGNIKIQKQFILEDVEKKIFYHCELVKDGNFQQVNGGNFIPQKNELHQYLNGFSLYSNQYFEQSVIITNLSLCGDYLHDMIVSTNFKGMFTILDQGLNERIQFTDVINNNSYFSKQFIELIQKIAKIK